MYTFSSSLYKLDILNSLKLFCNNKDLIKTNKCYDNIFDITVENSKSIKEYEIALCYYKRDNIPFLRHLVFVKKDKIIDPTILVNIKNIEELKRLEYLVIKKLELKEYLELCFEQMTTDIRGSKEEKSFFKQAVKSDIKLFDIDFIDYIGGN